MRLLLIVAILAQAAFAQTEREIRRSVERALVPIQKSAATFVEKRACFSCHHNGLTILTLQVAQGQQITIDDKVYKSVSDRTFQQVLWGDKSLDNAVQATNLNDPTPNDSLLLMAAGTVSPNDTMRVYAGRIASWQRTDGQWLTSDFRPPHSSSLFTATATAVRAIGLLGSNQESRVSAAVRWLNIAKSESTEDASFRLLGLIWARSSAIDEAQKDLLARRNADGGWGQISGYSSDAYSTGQAIYALCQSHVETTNPIILKAIKFLLNNQAPDGTWHVRSRMVSPAEVSPPYFSTGFPYGKDEFISYAGSNWAVMGLVSSLPPPQREVAADRQATRPDWVQTALFGELGGLRKLLDEGLNPNQETNGGTTLLMLAAFDPAKVTLVLSRGANPKKRAPSGVDALTVAASYYNNSESIKLLLAAGAEAQAPEGVKVQHTPLTFATMSGDIEAVKLLLAHGADPSEHYPLGEAITFNHADVAQALLDHGASAGAVESTGINLLHWATITDRPELIPILKKAGVPIDDVDEHGFTPLMYAATIDFGDTRALEALVAAGADTKIKNSEGKTALQQAQKLGHAGIVKVLSGQK